MTSAIAHSHKEHSHGVPLLALFIALLALTGAEIALYEIYRHAEQAGDPLMSKTALVMVLLFLLTLPKAAIVMIFFMHLKFERQLIVLLAVVPLFMTFLVVLPMLTDTLALKGHGQAENQAIIGEYHAVDAHGDDAHGDANADSDTEQQEEDSAIGSDADY